MLVLEQLGGGVAQPLGQVGAQLRERLAVVRAWVLDSGEHCHREPDNRARIVRGRVGLRNAPNGRHAEGDTNAIRLRLQVNPIRRNVPVYDVVLARPLEQSVHLTENCRDTRRGKPLSDCELLRQRIVSRPLRDDGKGVGSDPAALDHWNEAPVRRSSEQLCVGGEVRQCIPFVARR